MTEGDKNARVGCDPALLHSGVLGRAYLQDFTPV